MHQARLAAHAILHLAGLPLPLEGKALFIPGASASIGGCANLAEFTSGVAAGALVLRGAAGKVLRASVLVNGR